MKIVQEFEGQSIRVTPDGKFAASDVLKAIGQKNHKAAWTALKAQYPRLIDETSTFVFGAGRPPEVLTPNGAALLVGAMLRSKNYSSAARFAEAFNIQPIAVLPPEAETVRILCAAFQDERPETQLLCAGYRIDLFLPISRIAIECDEQGHTKYNADVERVRQQVITAQLGCRFYRYNPQQSGFNIGQVIYDINKMKEAASVLAAV